MTLNILFRSKNPTSKKNLIKSSLCSLSSLIIGLLSCTPSIASQFNDPALTERVEELVKTKGISPADAEALVAAEIAPESEEHVTTPAIQCSDKKNNDDNTVEDANKDNLLLSNANEILFEITKHLPPEALIAFAGTSKKAQFFGSDPLLVKRLWNKHGALPPLTTPPQTEAYTAKVFYLMDFLAKFDGLDDARKTKISTIAKICFEKTQNPLIVLAIDANSRHFFTTDMSESDREQIISALSSLSQNQIAAIATHKDTYFTADATISKKAELIRSFAKLSPDQIAAIATHKDTFFSADVKTYMINSLVEDLSPLSVEQIAAIATHKDTYFSDNMDQFERIDIIKALAVMLPEQIHAIAAHQQTYLKYDKYNIVKLLKLKALASMSVEQIEAIAALGEIYFGQLDNLIFEVAIIESLKSLTTDQINARAAAIKANSDALLTDDMGDYFRAAVVISLTKLTKDQINARSNAIKSNSHILFTEKMDGRARGYLIDKILMHSAEEIAVKAAAIQSNWDAYFADDMTGDVSAYTIVALSFLSVDQIHALAANGAEAFIEDAKHRKIGKVLEDGTYIPYAELDQ